MSNSESSESTSGGGLFQNAVYIGINLQNILYGIELLLYFKTIRILISRRRACKKSNVFYAFFSSMLVFLVTVWIAAQAVFGEKMWLIDSNFPGGPDEYWKKNISAWYMDWGTTASIILQLMTDALMIHRCRIVWNSYRVIIIPSILWLATFALGFVVDWFTSSPGGDFFTGISSDLVLTYYATSVFLNTILTCMICYRILRHGREIQAYLGHEHASLYFSLVTIVVESVFPYTISGIACLVSMGLGSPTAVVFICVYILMMCISPQMLILRLITGTAWEIDTLEASTSLSRFGTRSNGPRVDLQTPSKVYVPDGYGKV